MPKRSKIAVFWFRRDLRLEDNVAMHYALNSGFNVFSIFIFDQDLLIKIGNKKDRRVDYIHQALQKINSDLNRNGAKLNTFFDKPIAVFKSLSEDYDIQAIYCNCDYEPEAIKRDTEIYQYFKNRNIPFKAYKDQVIFDKNDVVKKDGSPYTVYTPYAQKWQENLRKNDYQSIRLTWENLFQQNYENIHSLKDIGFEKTDMRFGKPTLESRVIDGYDKTHNYPASDGATRLGIAIRFGTISIRKCVAFALEHNQTWLEELIWREFFMQILYHFPKVARHPFKKKYEGIKWRNNEKDFEQWCKGETGYPIVDSGMRELNQTGFMHNRVRMITASFLTKNLLIDWRWGEAYFAEKLLDYELSSNNGNWQWVAGCGCDAAPYFRIFNPMTQRKKFDPESRYIKKWIPELNTTGYPKPIVDYKMSRERALKVYKDGISGLI